MDGLGCVRVYVQTHHSLHLYLNIYIAIIIFLYNDVIALLIVVVVVFIFLRYFKMLYNKTFTEKLEQPHVVILQCMSMST
jgi:hypothetical protein